jgi:PAS domain S-box-containing protein
MHPLLAQHLKDAFGALEAVPPDLGRLLPLLDTVYAQAQGASPAAQGQPARPAEPPATHPGSHASLAPPGDPATAGSRELRFNAFMDNTPMVAALKDAHGILLYANKTCERIFPHISNLLGSASFTWLPPEIAGTRADDAEVHAAGHALESEQVVCLPGQPERHWLVIRFPVAGEDGRALVGVTALDVTERKRAEDALRRQALILETIHDAVIVIDPRGRIASCNAATCELSGYTRGYLIGQPPRFWRRDQDDATHPAEILKAVAREGRWAGDISFVRADGSEGVCETVVVPGRDERGETAGFIAVSRDITERRAMTRQLLQSQKLEAIGELAAGIAHEINTPSRYVTDNVHFLEQAFRDLLELARRHEELLRIAREQAPLAEAAAKMEETVKTADLEYLKTEVPSAIRQSLEGLQRIAEIVRGVQQFAHPGGGEKTGVDLNAALENVIMVARNEWKYVAEVETAFDPGLPPVPCFAGEINQVFLNILVNGAHAIGEVVSPDSGARGRIVVSTRRDGPWAEVRISDTGPGIPPEHQSRVFDLFFTTKPVGKGTGQGLAISHRVVVENHQGTIAFETARDQGTTFVVRLPLGAADAAPLERAA